MLIVESKKRKAFLVSFCFLIVNILFSKVESFTNNDVCFTSLKLKLRKVSFHQNNNLHFKKEPTLNEVQVKENSKFRDIFQLIKSACIFSFTPLLFYFGEPVSRNHQYIGNCYELKEEVKKLKVKKEEEQQNFAEKLKELANNSPNRNFPNTMETSSLKIIDTSTKITNIV